jgi:hypothetical protein
MSILTTRISPQRLLFIPFAALLVLPVGCRIEQERAAELPDVNVQVEPGQLPKYDIKGPDVNVRTVEETIVVPQVKIVQEKQTVQVPYIDVNLPGVERRRQTLTAEVTAPSAGYNLQIQDVYVVNDQVWVVARLNESDPNAPKTPVNVSDRIVLNAPEMPVRYYIVGERPVGDAGNQYTFVENRQSIEDQLASGQQLYSRQTG